MALFGVKRVPPRTQFGAGPDVEAPGGNPRNPPPPQRSTYSPASRPPEATSNVPSRPGNHRMQTHVVKRPVYGVMYNHPMIGVNRPYRGEPPVPAIRAPMLGQGPKPAPVAEESEA
jgi:hypothetical protein